MRVRARSTIRGFGFVVATLKDTLIYALLSNVIGLGRQWLSDTAQRLLRHLNLLSIHN